MITISLPWPHASLSSNSRAHWRAKATQTAKHRLWAVYAMQAERKPVLPAIGDIDVLLRFYPPHNRGDRSNYPHLAKAYLDGCADALHVDDRRFLPSYKIEPAQKPGRIEITISEDI